LERGEVDKVQELGEMDKIRKTPGDELFKDLHPEKPIELFVYDAFRYIIALSALNMALAESLCVFLYEARLIEVVIRIYMMVICAGVIIKELLVSIDESFFQNSWLARGVLYSFFGVVGIQQYESAQEQGEKYLLGYVVFVSSWMIACGIIYILMSIFCLHGYLNGIRDDYEIRIVRSKELRKNMQNFGMLS